MKMDKKLLSLLLCAVMMLGSVAIDGNGFAEVLDAFSVKASAAKVTSYKKGDIIEFGWYPQSKEINKSITDALTSSAGNTLRWNSYNYYSGTGDWYDGQMTPSNYMRYTDVMYGSTKYRGVVFDSYRPDCTGYTCSSDNSFQDDNGYTTGNVYWFKYEPIKWRVLDPATGMVMAETILDSPAFNNYILSSGSDEYGDKVYWGDSSKTYYANNYTESTIRKWLNDDFYNTAFSLAQQNIIQNTTLDNSACSTSYSKYNSESTNDKIYLLSYNDALNTSYGFNSRFSTYDASRRAKGSDYAKCQGLYVDSGGSYDGNSYWRLRSPGSISYSTCCVSDGGYVDGDFFFYFQTVDTAYGVRPALNFNLSSAIFQSDYAGSEIGSEDPKDKILTTESQSKNNSGEVVENNDSDNSDFINNNLDTENKLEYDPAEINKHQQGLGTEFKDENDNITKNNFWIILIAFAVFALVFIVLLIDYVIKRKRERTTDNSVIPPHVTQSEAPVVRKPSGNNKNIPIVSVEDITYQLIPNGFYGICQKCKNETDNIFTFKMQKNGIERSTQVCEKCGKELTDYISNRKKE